MDFSSFSDENFNVKQWVNSILITPEASDNVEGYVSQLVMKLQLFIQEVNNALEDTSQQVLHNLPRVVRDAEAIHQEVTLLQSQMKTVRDDIAKVEHDTAQSMQTLMKIDGIKSRMQTASKALQEADNWTTLSADVEDVFQAGDYHSIAAKLQGMQQSLKILVDIPDYNDRCQHLEKLKNKLEAMISPSLVTAINTQSVDAAQIYVKIFRDIDRLTALQKYYHKCQKEQLLLKWKEIVESDPDYTVLNWMALYSDSLLSNWHTQMKWFRVVFPDLSAVPLLCDILSDSLNSLDPPIAFCITSALKLQTDPLSFLIDLKQVFERFSRSISAAVCAHNPGLLVNSSVQQLAKTIFLSLKSPIGDYALLEEKFLLGRLETVSFQNEDLSEMISALADSVKKMFTFANEANNHCIQLTNGCCYPVLVSALRVVFHKYLEKVQQTFMHWHESLKLDVSRTKNDWSFLQQALQALQICGDILLQTEVFDQTLISNCLLCAKKLGLSIAAEEKKENNPFFVMDELLLNPNDSANLKALFIKLTEAADPSLLFDTKKSEIKICRNMTKIVFNIFFNEIKQHLSTLSEMKTWTMENPSGVLNIDLPAFGLSPQEYITQIGQYLMTVPLHLEPFAIQENTSLLKSLNYGKLPYSEGGDLDQGDHIADYFLSCIAAGTCSTYVENILQISQVTSYAAKQLATDIDYLCNVLDDLGLRPSKNLTTITALLKVPPENFTLSADGKPAQIVSAVRRLRNLSLSEKQ